MKEFFWIFTINIIFDILKETTSHSSNKFSKPKLESHFESNLSSQIPPQRTFFTWQYKMSIRRNLSPQQKRISPNEVLTLVAGTIIDLVTLFKFEYYIKWKCFSSVPIFKNVVIDENF